MSIQIYSMCIVLKQSAFPQLGYELPERHLDRLCNNAKAQENRTLSAFKVQVKCWRHGVERCYAMIICFIGQFQHKACHHKIKTNVSLQVTLKRCGSLTVVLFLTSLLLLVALAPCGAR